jgi:hypothetical protein
MDHPIYACLLVDDPPSNATYWARAQQFAFGYTPADRGGWGTNWRNLEPARWYRPADAHAFADLIEEFGVRGKFTLLPCPAGLGRIDQCVRSYDDGDLRELMATVRDRIAPQFDITPEVLTHSMLLDTRTMALLPHAETGWVTHACVTKQVEALTQYIGFGYQILRNVGIAAHGLTVGGMNDVSGIAGGKLLYQWDGAETLGRALLAVERQFDPGLNVSFVHLGAEPRSAIGKQTGVPESVYDHTDGGSVYYMHRSHEEVLFPLLHGPIADMESVVSAMITPDLSDGLLVREAEAGKVVVLATHGQTLNSMNSGAGTATLREILRRFHQRYGRRIVWQTCRELCQATGRRDRV